VNEDYRDILAALLKQRARFLVVGAHALAVHGYPRATVDIDIWIDASPENAERVWGALAEFGAPLEDLDIRREDLSRLDVVAQFGLPPNRIDILTGVSGLEFDEAWKNRVEEDSKECAFRCSASRTCEGTSWRPTGRKTART
jgi:hypothetical protein